jgi:hypothetical protein
VKTITEIESEEITVTERLDIPLVPCSDEPMTIGNKGNMHGAKTVNIPARIDIRKNNILLNF